jgi:hypothetical protein
MTTSQKHAVGATLVMWVFFGFSGCAEKTPTAVPSAQKDTGRAHTSDTRILLDASPQDASPQDASPQDASPQDASPQDAGLDAAAIVHICTQVCAQSAALPCYRETCPANCQFQLETACSAQYYAALLCLLDQQPSDYTCSDGNLMAPAACADAQRAVVDCLQAAN